MSATRSILNTDRLNYLNIGLIFLALGVAYYVPFELFLFSYAVLGPAHYLTEISWLHERNYFSKGKKDYILLGIAGIFLFILVYGNDLHIRIFDSEMGKHLQTATVYVAFIASLFMVILKDRFHRFIAFIVICATAVLSRNMVVFFSVFLPTLIHVFLFTGLFMLYGALKGRSRTGYLSVILLFLCPVIIFTWIPDLNFITEYARTHYAKFHVVNMYALNVFDPNVYHYPPQTSEGQQFLFNAIYSSKAGIALMRFIAFAYTYHYLNWFSKTTVIKWHLVPKKRLLIIGLLWLISVGLYLYKYEIGFNVLFLLSFLHVFLEFPLNHVTFIGIFKETRSILSGRPAETIPVKKGGKRK